MRRARRKTDAERGPLGAWAYNAMVDLGLSDEQIAARVEASSATVRKIAGGSERHPSARLLRAMHRYFMEVGAAATPPIPIDRPPGLEPDDNMAGAAGDTLTVPASLLTALAAQTAAISELVGELRSARLVQADLEERIGALETAAKLQGRSGAGASGGLPAPRQRAG